MKEKFEKKAKELKHEYNGEAHNALNRSAQDNQKSRDKVSTKSMCDT